MNFETSFLDTLKITMLKTGLVLKHKRGANIVGNDECNSG